MDLDLRQLAKIAWRWWWLLILCPLIAGGAAYYASSQQTPLYSSTVTLRVNPPTGSAADYSALQLTQNLTETYRRLLIASPILDRVVETLDLPYDSDELRSRASSSAIANTQLLNLSISDPDPQQAALIANTMADEFVAFLSEQTTEQFVTTQSLINSQLVEVQNQLESVRNEIADIERGLEGTDAEAQSQLDALLVLETQLAQQQATLQLQSQTLGVGLASSQAQVTVSEPARPPSAPYSPRTMLYTALGLFLGGMIAIAGIALLEYLDNTVRADTNIAELTGAALLAGVDDVPELKKGEHQLYTLSHPRSSAAEAIRLLRANLEFASAAQSLASLAITSAGPGEGKSTITANLAIVLAQAGYVTVVVDADLRKPTQHHIFNLSNRAGLSTLLTQPGRDWREIAIDAAVPNLQVIPSGPIPPNPSDLLSLDRFSELLTVLEREADIVLIDTPPVLAVSDPLLVGTKTDGVLLLGHAGHTRRERLAHAAETLRGAGTRLVGVVINRQSARDVGYYYYYYGDYSQKPEKNKRGLKGVALEDTRESAT